MKLEKNEYYKVLSLIKELPFDSLFAYALADGLQDGEIYVDDKVTPSSALLKHSCGYAYTLGNSQNSEFNALLHTLLLPTEQFFMLCPHTPEWEQTLHSFTDLNLEPGQRFCFHLNPASFHFEDYPLPADYQIVAINHALFKTLAGKVIPSHYWHSAEYFLQKGYGVCLINPEGQIVSSSFSSCIADGYIDIGIQTTEGFEGHGFATLTAARMVQYGLMHGYTPVWGCNTRNAGSCSVAHKLGFQKTGCWNTLHGGIRT